MKALAIQRLLSELPVPRPTSFGTWHLWAVLVYLAIVFGHFSEHLVQAVQVFVLGWERADAGGILGLALAELVNSEVLHFSYNSLQLTGLIVLAYGFRHYRTAHAFWTAALVAQSWHWLEHAFLIVQLLSGHYFYGAVKQMSVLERFVPRIELHLSYNLVVFVPTLIAVTLYLKAIREAPRG